MERNTWIWKPCTNISVQRDSFKARRICKLWFSHSIPLFVNQSDNPCVRYKIKPWGQLTKCSMLNSTFSAPCTLKAPCTSTLIDPDPSLFKIQIRVVLWRPMDNAFYNVMHWKYICICFSFFVTSSKFTGNFTSRWMGNWDVSNLISKILLQHLKYNPRFWCCFGRESRVKMTWSDRRRTLEQSPGIEAVT